MDSTEIYKQFGLKEPVPFHPKLTLHVGEEHNEIRLIIKHHLQKLGFHDVRTDRDGLSVLSELKNHPADIALEGDDLPNLNGYDILKELREDPNAIRPAFIIFSKPLNKNELMFALEKGIDEIIVRPLIQADLLPKIRSAYNNFINPRNPERIYEYAKSKLRDKDLDEAYKVYTSLSALSDKAARPLVGMARILMMKERYPDAINSVTKSIERNENYVHAFSLRGEIYAKQGQFDKALEDLKKAVELSPLNIARYEQCCEILLSQNRIDECQQILTLGLKAGLKHPYLIERIGFCYFKNRLYTEALKFLKEAVHLAPDDISFSNSLAICYRDSKDYEKAIMTYNQILKRNTENHLILFNKALTLILWDKKDDAIKLLRRVIKIDPSYTKAFDKLHELGDPIEGGSE